MWKQWVNVILGIVVAVMVGYGASVAWLVTGGILIALISLWAGLEGASSGQSTAHAR